jgi:hypothetical protein
VLRYTDLSIRLLILLSVLPLASCVQLSGPLSDPDKAKPDRELLGVWRNSDNAPGYSFLFVGSSGDRHQPPGIVEVIQVESNRHDNIMARQPLLFFTTAIGKSKYANIKYADFVPAADRAKLPTRAKRYANGYALIKYQVEQDRLSVWLPDSEEAVALVQTGKLKGSVEDGGLLKLKLATIDDSPGLSRFLGDGGDKVLFPDKHKSTFTRVR